MSKIFDDNSQTIGHTPLVRLKHFGKGNILAKIESHKMSYCIKYDLGCRKKRFAHL